MLQQQLIAEREKSKVRWLCVCVRFFKKKIIFLIMWDKAMVVCL